MAHKHFACTMTKVFFVNIVFSNKLRNDTLCDGACLFFVLANGSLAQIDACAEVGLIHLERFADMFQAVADAHVFFTSIYEYKKYYSENQ